MERDYYEGFTDMIVETEKSNDLLSENWSPRKVAGVVQSQRLKKKKRGLVI